MLIFLWFFFLVIFSLSLWGIIVSPKQNQVCYQVEWKEINGTILSVSSKNYSFKCHININGFISETMNEKYEVVTLTINEKKTGNNEKYWCCCNNTNNTDEECAFITIYYHGNIKYEDCCCFSFVSLGRYTSLPNVTVNEESIAWVKDKKESSYAFSDSPSAADCFSSITKKRFLSIIGVVLSSLSLLFLTWMICLTRNIWFLNYFTRYHNPAELLIQ